ncbi:uncharacterized protein [Clytia hemisphaerica]
MSTKSIRRINEYYNWQFEDDGREAIREWSRKRIQKMRGFNKSYYGCLVYTFHLDTLKSFVENFNFMVILQMFIAAGGVYLFDHFDIHYNFNAALFVSPIVFPLAFSINTDFQRREKVLDDLANFKSSSMLWFFCMREWKKGAGLDDEWMNQIQKKLHSIMFNLREYLLTSRSDRRNIIARYMYEDYSDCSQLIDNVRESKLPANPALISRAYHLLQAICLSFERLRVIREYRSPRSIRSFNKVLVLLLPIILCPYFVALTRAQSGSPWGAYLIAVLVAAIYGALQGVQDKLDDPFDGMSEDDINLDTIDEWTFNSLENAAKRDYDGFKSFIHNQSGTVDEKDAETTKNTKLNGSVSSSNDPKTPPQIYRPKTRSIAEILREMQEKDAAGSRNHSFKNKKNPIKKISMRLIEKMHEKEKNDSDNITSSSKAGNLNSNPTEKSHLSLGSPSNRSVSSKKSLSKVSFSDDMVNFKKENSGVPNGDDDEYDDAFHNGTQAAVQPLLGLIREDDSKPKLAKDKEVDIAEIKAPEKDSVLKLTNGVAYGIKDSEHNIKGINDDDCERDSDDSFQEVVVID